MLLDQNPVEEDLKPWNMDLNTYCMLMHLSLFASSIFPMAGIILPLIMWQQFKKQSNKIDQNGKNIMNFLLTTFVAGIVIFFVFLVVFALILVPEPSSKNLISASLLIVLFLFIIGFGIGYVVLVILAAIKSYNNEIGTYPLTFKFIK